MGQMIRMLRAELDRCCVIVEPKSRHSAEDRQLADELAEILDLVLQTLDAFETTVKARDDPHKYAQQLLALGVRNPKECGCDLVSATEVERWRHANHLRFNRAVWEILWSHQVIILIQTAILADPQLVLEARQLLDHFLSNDPDPEWIGPR